MEKSHDINTLFEIQKWNSSANVDRQGRYIFYVKEYQENYRFYLDEYPKPNFIFKYNNLNKENKK
jgi:hypothetical protein